MPTWLVFVVIVVAVASRPIEVLLWRAGRLSDRALAILLLGRFPLLTIVFAVVSGTPLPLLVVLLAISFLPGLFLYRHVLRLIQEQAADWRRSGAGETEVVEPPSGFLK